MSKPTKTRILELLAVDVTSGKIHWRRSHGRVRAGAIAGRVTYHGYREVCVDKHPLMAHQIVWLCATGDWPALIDHIDGNKQNNAFANIREADAATNARNRTNWEHTKLLGAHPLPNGRFAAAITADGKPWHLGTFDTEAEAHARYVEAREQCAEAERHARLTVLEELQAGRVAA